MIAAVALFLFAGAAIAALSIIGYAVAPQWRRILRLAAGHHETRLPPVAAHWREVHLAGDRGPLIEDRRPTGRIRTLRLRR